MGFRNGEDGEPWTWVMGEHPKDKTIDQMLEEEAQRQAMNLAEHEAEATLRKLQEQEELANKLESQCFNENDTKKVVEQLWKQNISSAPVGDFKNVSSQPEPKASKPGYTKHQQQQQQPAEPKAPLRTKVNSNMMASINSVKEKRSSEIFASLQFQRQQSIDEAEQQGQTINSQWLEQEKKSKQEEEKQRLIAKKAREDHRRTMRKLKTESQIIGTFTIGLRFAAVDKPTPGASKSTKARPPRPSSKEEVMKWFRETELPKGSGLDPRTKQLADYFHGMISREHAESMLRSRSTGSFVIRLSDKVWGYGLSYKGEGANIKHYLIDVTDVGYQFFGTNQIVHKSLADFVTHYQNNSMCLVERELLTHPCPHGKQQRKDCEALVKVDSPGGEVSYL